MIKCNIIRGWYNHIYVPLSLSLYFLGMQLSAAWCMGGRAFKCAPPGFSGARTGPDKQRLFKQIQKASIRKSFLSRHNWKRCVESSPASTAPGTIIGKSSLFHTFITISCGGGHSLLGPSWFFIGPRSDHSLRLSSTQFTDSLTESQPCWRLNELNKLFRLYRL